MKSKLALALALIIPASFAFADEPKVTQDGAKPPHHQRMGKEGFMNKMAQDLNLNDTQKADIEKIMSDSREETNSKIMKVLTPEQQTKFEELKKQHPHGGNRVPRPKVDNEAPKVTKEAS